MSVTLWNDDIGTWLQDAPYRTWEFNKNELYALEVMVISDGSLGGFIEESVVEETVSIESSSVGSDLWSSCAADPDTVWIPEDAALGNPGEC